MFGLNIGWSVAKFLIPLFLILGMFGWIQYQRAALAHQETEMVALRSDVNTATAANTKLMEDLTIAQTAAKIADTKVTEANQMLRRYDKVLNVLKGELANDTSMDAPVSDRLRRYLDGLYQYRKSRDTNPDGVGSTP